MVFKITWLIFLLFPSRKRITPRNVMLAVRNDSELDQMFGKYIIAFAGVSLFFVAFCLQIEL